jgi:hypothetical protein
MRKIILMLGLVAILAGGLWGLLHSTHPAPVKASLYETSLTESLVRNILDELKTNAPPLCFLAFGEGVTPPSPHFIRQFAGSRPAVRSGQYAAASPTGQYVDYMTGQPGVILRIIRLKQLDPNTFEVLVGFSNRPPGQDRFLYRVCKVGSRWTLIGRKPV